MKKVIQNSKYHINFMGQKTLAFTVSGLISIVVIYFLFAKGLNFGVDFTGGIVMEIQSNKEIEINKTRKFLAKKATENHLGEATVQKVGDNEILIRLAVKHSESKEINRVIENIKSDLKGFLGEDIDFRKIDFVGPQVGSELIKGAIIAVILSFVGIMIYIWIRFDWQYGIGALIALLHDGIVVLGVYLIGNVEFNITSIAAILTVIGYSVNDSVVIYDRIRENIRKYKNISVDELINISINDTLSRTILTAGTTLLSLVALLAVGGDVIHGFSLACFIGILTGTYSSIYISAPVLRFVNLKSAIKN
jgi:preprotein translocase SecF subunit